MPVDNLTPYWKLEPQVAELRKLLSETYEEIEAFLAIYRGTTDPNALWRARASVLTALSHPLLKEEEEEK